MAAVHVAGSATVRRCSSTDTNVELAYETFGSRDDTAVLLVVGLNAQCVVWHESFCRALAAAGPFFVIRYDNRDTGFSTKFDHLPSASTVRVYLLPPHVGRWQPPYALRDMALDGLALLDRLGIATAHVVGCSMGGMIAQLMAIEAPDRVRSLTSIMSTTGNRHLERVPLWVQLLMLRKPKSRSLEDLVEFRAQHVLRVLAPIGPLPEEYTAFIWALAREQMTRTTYGAGFFRQFMAIQATESRDDALKKLTLPALVVHGDHDYLIPTSHGYHTAAVFGRHGKLVIVPQMGHHFGPAFFQPVVDGVVEMHRRHMHPQ